MTVHHDRSFKFTLITPKGLCLDLDQDRLPQGFQVILDQDGAMSAARSLATMTGCRCSVTVIDQITADPEAT